MRKIRYLPFNPLHHLRNECSAHRIALEALRDDAAERLGKFVFLKSTYHQSEFSSSLPTLLAITTERFAYLDNSLKQKKADFLPECQTPSQIVQTLNYLSQNLRVQKNTFASLFTPHRKPSTFTLIWPKLILVPSVTFILFRAIYTPGLSNVSTYTTIKMTFFQIQDTAVGFWNNYLLEPLREILDTMRTGGSDSTRLVNPQGVQADVEVWLGLRCGRGLSLTIWIQSLHRMAISLTRDTYRALPEAPKAHTPALDELTAQIASGDLTPVLKIYENDLRSPFRSALTGSLIRSLLVQVQRMKVCSFHFPRYFLAFYYYSVLGWPFDDTSITW